MPAPSTTQPNLQQAQRAQSATPELRRWIIEQAASGIGHEDILAAMRRSGWDEAVAMDAMEQTLTEHLAEQAELSGPAELGVHPVPEPDLARSPTLLHVEGHALQVLAAMQHPRVVVFGGLLTAEECHALVELARPRLTRSETVDTATGGSEVNAARTSDGMFFSRGETELIDRVERRIAALLRWPVERGEGLQVLRYRPGAEYRPHHDYFDPERPGSATVLQRGGQRVGTLVMYLNTPQGGGATTFPDVGFEVAPVQGNAVFFSYEHAHPSSRTLHGGAPVLAGEKWVATKWLRQRRFD